MSRLFRRLDISRGGMLVSKRHRSRNTTHLLCQTRFLLFVSICLYFTGCQEARESRVLTPKDQLKIVGYAIESIESRNLGLPQYGSVGGSYLNRSWLLLLAEELELPRDESEKPQNQIRAPDFCRADLSDFTDVTTSIVPVWNSLRDVQHAPKVVLLPHEQYRTYWLDPSVLDVDALMTLLKSSPNDKAWVLLNSGSVRQCRFGDLVHVIEETRV